jgi:FtsH-binding integral membrane protein
MIPISEELYTNTMDRNPYTPPQSLVVDVPEEDRLEERPSRVSTAVRLFWIELAISVFHAAWNWNSSADVVLEGVVVLVEVATLGFEAWVIYKISRGRNWARIVALVSVSLAVLLFVGTFKQSFARSPTSVALGVTETVLDAIALYLLFTGPGRRWFRARLG